MDTSPQLKKNLIQNKITTHISAVLMAFMFVVCSPNQVSATELLSFSDINRLGAFRVPVHLETNSANGGIEINPVNNSFYLVGHERRSYVAELSLPDTISSSTNLTELSTATLLQDFQNIMQRVAGGSSETIDTIAGLKIVSDSHGNKKLIGSGYQYYDTDGQINSHFVINDPDDLATTNIDGYFSVQGPARKQYGYMVELPQKWQQIFGKTHIIGQSSGPAIISGMSPGPTAYAVNLDELGNQSDPDTVTLLEYDFSDGKTLNPGGPGDINNTSGTNDIWTRLSWATGVFISGDTIGFFGHSGGHNEGIDYKEAVQNPCIGTGGYGAHNCDYDYHYWFYDLNELKKVMDGELLAYEVLPYEQGPFILPFGNGSNRTGGVATDPRTGYVYLTQLKVDSEVRYSNRPIVHVFDIGIIAGSDPGIIDPPVVNQSPVLHPIGNKTTNIDTLLTFNVTASDPDNDSLTITAQGLPQGASFIDNIFNWTPSSGQSGKYSVTFDATDNQLSDSETVTIIAQASVDNTPPPMTYTCSDTIDNDNDGLIDFPADPGCSNTTDNDETNTVDPSPQPAPPSAGPLSFSNIKRIGAFRLPYVNEANYARGVIEYNPDNNSFYMAGHQRRNHIAEFRIPDILSTSTNLRDLSTATLVQDFQDILQRAAGGDDETIERVGGLKLITDSQGNKKLIGSGYEYYDNTGQIYTHFVIDNPDNLASSNVNGYFAIDGPGRKQSGYMVELPQKWQEIFGKTHIAGQSSGLPITNGLSVGPAAYAVNLEEIGKQPDPKTITLLEYSRVPGETLNPGGPDDLKNQSGTNDIWTQLSRATGVFISGDTIGFLGHSGGHNEGVAYKDAIINPCAGTGGYGANNCDYDYHYWFYNLNDLKKVMDGELQAHQVQPYEHGSFALPWGNGSSGTGGISLDPLTGHVYITQLSADREAAYSNLPVVHVFNIGVIEIPVINPVPILTSIGN